MASAEELEPRQCAPGSTVALAMATVAPVATVSYGDIETRNARSRRRRRRALRAAGALGREERKLSVDSFGLTPASFFASRIRCAPR